MLKFKSWWRKKFPIWEQDVHMVQQLEINTIAHSDPDPSFTLIGEFRERSGCSNPDREHWCIVYRPIHVYDRVITVDGDSRKFVIASMKWYRINDIVKSITYYRNGVVYRTEDPKKI